MVQEFFINPRKIAERVFFLIFWDFPTCNLAIVSDDWGHVAWKCNERASMWRKWVSWASDQIEFLSRGFWETRAAPVKTSRANWLKFDVRARASQCLFLRGDCIWQLLRLINRSIHPEMLIDWKTNAAPSLLTDSSFNYTRSRDLFYFKNSWEGKIFSFGKFLKWSSLFLFTRS